MTKFYCPDCKRTVTGKKQWLDFFITWIAFVTVFAILGAAALFLSGYSLAQQSDLTTLSQTSAKLFLFFGFLMAVSPFFAYGIIHEKCPICNLDEVEASAVEPSEKKNDAHPNETGVV